MPLELQRRLQSWVICISRYIVARPCVRRTVSVICHDDNHKVAPREAAGFSFFKRHFPGVSENLNGIEELFLVMAPVRIILKRIFFRFLVSLAHFCKSRGNLLSE